MIGAVYIDIQIRRFQKSIEMSKRVSVMKKGTKRNMETMHPKRGILTN
jgi:hypothetical protein